MLEVAELRGQDAQQGGQGVVVDAQRTLQGSNHFCRVGEVGIGLSPL